MKTTAFCQRHLEGAAAYHFNRAPFSKPHCFDHPVVTKQMQTDSLYFRQLHFYFCLLSCVILGPLNKFGCYSSKCASGLSDRNYYYKHLENNV